VETAWPGQAQVTPGEDDTFFGWLKSASGSGSLVVSVYYLDGDGNQVGTTQTISATDNADGWTEFAGQFTAPAGAVTAYETIESSGGGTHYVDDLEVATS
jgi:hypothetical protein